MTLAARVYVDTSVLVSAFTHEPQQAVALGLLQAPEWDQVCVSDWTMAEFACAIQAKVLRGETSASLAHTLRRTLTGLIDQGALLRLPVLREDFSAVERTTSEHLTMVRGADALHIAVAARSGVSHFASLDKTQRVVARRWLLGVECLPKD